VKFPSVEPSIAAAAVELSTQAGRFRDVVPVIRKLLMREDPETVAEELPKWQVLIDNYLVKMIDLRTKVREAEETVRLAQRVLHLHHADVLGLGEAQVTWLEPEVQVERPLRDRFRDSIVLKNFKVV